MDLKNKSIKSESQFGFRSLPLDGNRKYEEHTLRTPTFSIKKLSDLQKNLPALCSHIFAVIGSQQQEAVYQRCLVVDLKEAGVEKVEIEVELPLTYKGHKVGTRRADMIVELASGERAILELKAVDEMKLPHRKQLEYYLHYFDIHTGYLINFPHDDCFPDVTNKSSFMYRQVSDLAKRLEQLLVGGPTLRLRNAPHKRPVEVLEIKRETGATLSVPRPQIPQVYSFGITKSGEPCKVCRRQGGFCRQHQYQQKHPVLM